MCNYSKGVYNDGMERGRNTGIAGAADILKRMGMDAGKIVEQLKSLLLIPVNMGKMVVAKVMVILVFSVGTYFVLFLAAFAVEMAFHAQVLTAAIFWHYLKIYLVDGICVFFAVLPIICFITEKKLDYWLSLLAAEVYSFITIFVGNLGTISKLYPLVAAFTLSGYYESTPAEILLSVISMALCGTISGILIYRLSKRDALQ